jgi:DNA (cytosine-5)-methyltransferase 3A
MKQLSVISLFDGISCGRLALERANIIVETYCAYEVDKYAIKISQSNYPDIIQCGNVLGADFIKHKGFDLLLGGSPCTYWSINKKYRETTRNGIGFDLFMRYVNAKNESECKYFIYENNYKIHVDIQNEISYLLGVEPILINSQLVSGQSRNRLYWTNIPIVALPKQKDICVIDIIDNVEKENLISETIFNVDDIPIKENKIKRIGTIGKGGQGERIYSIYGKSVNLTANGGGRGAKTGLYKIGNTVRKLTPIECERLQTIPDNYTQGISDTQRIKCIGNGWTIDVISHILKNIVHN